MPRIIAREHPPITMTPIIMVTENPRPNWAGWYSWDIRAAHRDLPGPLLAKADRQFSSEDAAYQDALIALGSLRRNIVVRGA